MPNSDHIYLTSAIKRKKIDKTLYPSIFKLTIFLSAWKKIGNKMKIEVKFEDFLKTNELTEENLRIIVKKNSKSTDDIFSLFLKTSFLKSYDSYHDIIYKFIADMDTSLSGDLFYKRMMNLFNISSIAMTNQIMDVINLMLELTGQNSPDNRIYFPLAPNISDFSDQLYRNWFIDHEDKELFLETKIFKILAEADNITLKNKDPLIIDNPFGANKYDAAITFMPSNTLASIPDNSFDIYAPFREGQHTRYGETIYWLKLLSASDNVAVCSYPGPFFRGGEEEALRKKLVEMDWIKGIIHLPEKMNPYNKNALQIIVFDKSKKSKNIIFMDASKLASTDIILSKFKNSDKEKTICRKVDKQEIAMNHYSLLVNRYISDQDKMKEKNTAAEELVALDDI
ncbi:MAG: N-6 DNA methylase, partial [Spirochaetota bacterium]|nr:N-6 DNA methylase [Spirochaetota bacterium]